MSLPQAIAGFALALMGVLVLVQVTSPLDQFPQSTPHRERLAQILALVLVVIFLVRCETETPTPPVPACQALYIGQIVKVKGSTLEGSISLLYPRQGTSWVYFQGLPYRIEIACKDIEPLRAGIE